MVGGIAAGEGGAGVDPVQGGPVAAQEIQSHLEILFRLPGETDDEVRRQEKARHRAP